MNTDLHAEETKLIQAPAPITPVANLRSIQLSFGSHSVLQGLDWQLLPGQVVGLLGRNGAGKSSLLETLLGLREPDAGTVHLFGQTVAQLGDAQRAQIGYVPQQSDLFEWMTATQMLAYFRSFYPRWNEAKVEGLLSRWCIDRHKPIAQLSGGQQQRLSIIRALAHDPDLLVLDEPVASLDPIGRRDFLDELIHQVLERGSTVIFSTHILSDLERVAFDVAFLSGGRIVLQSPLDDLLESCHSVSGPGAIVQAFLQQPGLAVLRHRTLEGGRVHCLVRLPTPDTPDRRNGMECQRVSLETLFMELAQ